MSKSMSEFLNRYDKDRKFYKLNEIACLLFPSTSLHQRPNTSSMQPLMRLVHGVRILRYFCSTYFISDPNLLLLLVSKDGNPG